MTLFDIFTEIKHQALSFLVVFNLHNLPILFVLGYQQHRAVKADASQNFPADLYEAHVVHGLGQFDVTEMPGAVREVGLAGLAEQHLVHCAHAQVVDAPARRITLLVYHRGFVYLAN